MRKKTEELLIEGKPISEWATDQGWLQIGSWQIDPKTFSLSLLNDILESEIKLAKQDALTEAREAINKSNELLVIMDDKKVFLDADGVLTIFDFLIESYKPESKLPNELDSPKEDSHEA